MTRPLKSEWNETWQLHSFSLFSLTDHYRIASSQLVLIVRVKLCINSVPWSHKHKLHWPQQLAYVVPLFCGIQMHIAILEEHLNSTGVDSHMACALRFQLRTLQLFIEKLFVGGTRSNFGTMISGSYFGYSARSSMYTGTARKPSPQSTCSPSWLVSLNRYANPMLCRPARLCCCSESWPCLTDE